MLVLLERLSPVERAVFVLRESFDFDFAEIAAIVERSEDNCRQILARARRRVDDERPRFDADPRERRALAARFLAAAREGDLDGLVALLAPDAVLIGDGGGIARSIPRPMVGAAAVARAIVAFYGQIDEWGVTLEPAWVNGQPGFRTIAPDGRLVNVVGLDMRGRPGGGDPVHAQPAQALAPRRDLGLGPASFGAQISHRLVAIPRRSVRRLGSIVRGVREPTAHTDTFVPHPRAGRGDRAVGGASARARDDRAAARRGPGSAARSRGACGAASCIE